MMTFLSRATFVAGILAIGLNSPTVRAQAPTAQPASVSGTNVAVIDLGEVFKQHKRLQAQLEEVKQDAQGFEAFLRQENKKLESMAEQLKTLKPGTPDYEGREKAFATLRADLNVQIRQKTREFQEREAKIRYNAYQEVVESVRAFAQNYRIQLVIRFSRQEIDASKPQSVVMGLSRPIVYQNQLDITDHIILAVNRNQVPAQASRSMQIPRRN